MRRIYLSAAVLLLFVAFYLPATAAALVRNSASVIWLKGVHNERSLGAPLDVHQDDGIGLTLVRDLERARAVWQEAVQALAWQPRDSAALRLKALAEFALRRPLAAEASLRQVVELAPCDALAQLWLGDVLEAQGRREEAITAWHSAGASVVLARRALHYAQQGDLDQARQLFQIAFHIEDGDDSSRQTNFVKLYRDFGELLWKAGRRDEGTEVLEQTVEIAPECAHCRFVLGLAYYHQGALRDAITQYRIATEIEPTRLDYHIWLGFAYRDHGNDYLAEAEFLRVLQMEYVAIKDGTYIAHWKGRAAFELGKMYWLKQRPDEAEDFLRKATSILRSVPIQDVGTYIELGDFYREMGCLPEALMAYQWAVATDPARVDAQLRLADAYLQTGQLSHAIERYRAALQLDPGNLAIQKLLDTALRIQGH